MEQLEFDCRLESERELEENVNIALEFACKQVKETSKSKVSNRHDGYSIASEFYAGMKLDQKKVDESMKDFLRILPTEDDAKAVEAASSLKNAATGLVLQATKLAAQADRIMHDLYDEVSSYTTPVEDYLEGQFEDAEADPEAEAEEEKGNALVKETFPLLKECEDINFVGSIEAREIPHGYADVIVCEAFTGNVILKLYEGVASTLMSAVKQGMMSSLKSKIGALMVKPALKSTLKQFDTAQYGGAPLLGLNGLVVKTHGSSKAAEIKNTILQCAVFQEQDINQKIKTYIVQKQEEQE